MNVQLNSAVAYQPSIVRRLPGPCSHLRATWPLGRADQQVAGDQTAGGDRFDSKMKKLLVASLLLVRPGAPNVASSAIERTQRSPFAVTSWMIRMCFRVVERSSLGPPVSLVRIDDPWNLARILRGRVGGSPLKLEKFHLGMMEPTNSCFSSQPQPPTQILNSPSPPFIPDLSKPGRRLRRGNIAARWLAPRPTHHL